MFDIKADHNRLILLAPVLLAILTLASGCSFIGQDIELPNGKAASATLESKATATTVKVDSDGLALGQTEAPAVSPQQLVDTVSGLLQRQKVASAHHFVHLYPDVAWDLLRNTTANDAPNEAIQTIAAAHDHQCTHGNGTLGWQTLMLDRAQNPDRYHAHDGKRKDFLVRLRNGNPQGALAMQLDQTPHDAPGVLLDVDAGHLIGVALLLDQRPAEAADVFAQAIGRADSNHPYAAAHLKLLLSDALRRAGNVAAADTTWQDAAWLAGSLVAAGIPITDPIFWERAGYLRPVDKRWPVALTDVLVGLTNEKGVAIRPTNAVVPVSAPAGPHVLSDEQALWTCIGFWRLDRGEPQAALVALKRAEAMMRTEPEKHRLQLAQAKALLMLEQPAAATATLLRLASSPEPQLNRAAMAALGTSKLQSGSTKQGFNLLRRAVEEDANVDWPGRAEAEADLGLAYLLIGDEQSGLNWLHRAQARFESTGAHDNLVQSLENELAYLEQAKNKKEAKALRERIAALESGV